MMIPEFLGDPFQLNPLILAGFLSEEYWSKSPEKLATDVQFCPCLVSTGPRWRRLSILPPLIAVSAQTRVVTAKR